MAQRARLNEHAKGNGRRLPLSGQVDRGGKGSSLNRTPLPRTFLWWANVGVRVHEQYQAFFPADVTVVADHAKRALTSFSIALDFYYGVDYRKGVDLSWYRNIPVPTSYMVTDSKYDFFGGYDLLSTRNRRQVLRRPIAFPHDWKKWSCLKRRYMPIPRDAKAAYYPGNLYYDKRRYEEAIRCWRASMDIDPTFYILCSE